MMKPKVSKVVYPDSNSTLNEWTEEFKFGSAYVKPTPYFQNNELNFRVYTKKLTLLDKIDNYFRKLF